MRLPTPIQRPYTALFMRLRERTSAIIERMEEESGRPLPPKDRFIVTEEFEQYDIGAILVRVEWDEPRFVLQWAIGEDPPSPDAGSQAYALDLSELRHEALASEAPRDHFESYAAYIVSVAQSYLTEFFRDGPTDDIPYPRQSLAIEGLAFHPGVHWIGDVTFTFDDSRQPRR